MIKYSKKRSGLSVAFLIMAFCFGMSTQAQQKSVKVKVITNGNNREITIDTTIVDDNVLFLDFDDQLRSINMDSLFRAHSNDMEKIMEEMSINMDSFPNMDFNFNFDGDMEEIHQQIAKVLAHNGVKLENLGKLQSGTPHKKVLIGDDNEQGEDSVMVQSFVDEDGNHVKIIKKRIRVGDNEEEENTIIINSSDDGDNSRTKMPTNNMTINVEAIPMEEISMLKKLGYSKKALFNEPLNVENFKVSIKKKIENDLKQMFVKIECQLPEDEGDCEMQMIKKDGGVKVKEEDVLSGEVKKEFEVKQEEAPYYFILSKNNRLFGRKISL